MTQSKIFTDAAVTLTGGLSFRLPLFEIPGPEALSSDLALVYSSDVADTVNHWNLTHPASDVGLGWHIPRWRIVQQSPFGASRAESRFTLSTPLVTCPLFYVSTAADGVLFAAETEPFWRIVFDAQSNIWTVTDQNGLTHRFDGQSAGETAVTCGDWFASTTQLDGQRATTVAWNRTSVTDLFGNQVRYGYDIATQTLAPGGQSYAQASYLSSIIGCYGDTIRLSYADKTPNEYAAAFTNPAPPNAYQGALATKYLNSVSFQAAFATSPARSVRLNSDAAFIGGDGSDPAFTKRRLLGLTWASTAGRSTPPLTFDYAPSNDPLTPGALTKVTLPTGGNVSYTYGRAGGASGVLAYSDRSLPVTPPTVSGVTFSKPHLYFEDQYAVVTWVGSDNRLSVVPYRWEGRWLEGAARTLVGAGDASVKVALGGSLFAVGAGSKVLCAHIDPADPGKWIATIQTPFGASGVVTEVAVGDRFVAALAGATRQLQRVDFASLAWAPAPVETLGTASSKGLAFAAQGNRLLWAAVTGAQAVLTCQTRGFDATWSAQTTSAPWAGAGPVACAIDLARAGALLSVESTATGAAATTGYGVVWGDSDLTITPLGSFHGIGLARGASGMALRLGGSVWRFDGTGWIPADLAALGMATGETLGTVTFAEDLVAREIKASGGAVTRYDLVAYDANTGAWSQVAQTPKPASGTGHAAAPLTLNGPSRYAVAGETLYYMAPDMTWAAATGTAPAFGTADGAVSLVQSDFTVFQTTDAGTKKTNLAFLDNGGSAAVITVEGALAPPAGSNLAGVGGFAAYTGTWDGAGFALTLYRPIGNACTGKQSAITVTKISADPGYAAETATPPGAPGPQKINGPTVMSFAYDVVGATISADGRPRFNHVTSFPGSDQAVIGGGGKSDNYMFNGLTASETPVKAAPTDAASTNAADYPALTVGISYLSEATKKPDAGAETVVSSDTSYIWSTLSPTVAGWTSHNRCRRSDKMLDQVVATRTSTFSTETGQPVTISELNKAADGSDITVTTTFKYFWEVYDTTRALNILTPTILMTETSTAGRKTTPVKSQAVTWQNTWPSGVAGWGPMANFRRTVSDAAPFNAWQPGQQTPPGWQRTLAMPDRNARGTPSVSVDTAGNVQATIFSADNVFALADSDNAAGDAVSFFGAEVYETPGPWTPDTDRPVSAMITTADSHTGLRCLSLGGANATATAITGAFAPVVAEQVFLFSAWVRLLSGFDASKGATSLTAMLYWTESGTGKSASLATFDLGAAAAPWTYVQTLLDVPTALGSATPDAGSLYVTIELRNANTDTAIYLDELRFAPLDGGLSARVFDTDSGLVSAEIDQNGQSMMTVFDDQYRPLAQLNAVRQVTSLTPNGFSVQLKGGDSFVPTSPNTTFDISPGTNSAFDDFRSETPDAWTFTNDGGTWQITGGELVFSGGPATGLGGLAQPKGSNTANFAAYVEVKPDPGSTAALGDGTIYLRWSPGNGTNGTYAFVRDASGTLTTLQTTTEMAFGSSWLLVAIDGLYYAAIDGVPILALELDATPASGKVTLAGGKGTRFDNLLRIDEPSVAVTFTDGLGRDMQTASIEGRVPEGQDPGTIKIMVDGAFTDQMGRPIIRREALNATLGLSSESGTASRLLLGAPTEYVVTPNGPSPTLDAYFSDGVSGILAYVAEYFENSPLGRVTQIFDPRPSGDGSGTDSLRTVSYGATDNPAPSIGNTAGSTFRKTETVEAIGTPEGGSGVIKQVQGEIQDVAGNVLSSYEGPTDGAFLLQKTYAYDDAGRLESVTEAQAAGAGVGNAAAPTYKQSIGYDDLSRVISVTGPDAGQVQVIYDSSDRMRFSMDQVGATAKVGGTVVQRIRYVRYDTQGRTVESGYIQSADYQWGSAALLAKVDDQGFPKVTNGSGTGPVVTGVWRVQNTWDSDGTPRSVNLVGRLWQEKTQDDAGGNLFVRQMQYDALGQVTGVQETLPWSPPGGSGNETVSTGYDYTITGQIKSVTFPKVGADDFSVGYAYDRLGRFGGVGLKTAGGDVLDPTKPPPATAVRYAGYTYDDFGRMAATSFNQSPTAQEPAFQRTQTYDDYGRLTGLKDPYLSITLGYTDPEVGAFSDNRPVSMTLAYLMGTTWPLPPSAGTYKLAYDGYGRLTEATSSLSDAYSFTAPATGTAGGYDKNGNRVNSTHGVSRYVNAYPDTDGVPANGIAQITPNIAVTQDFESPNDDRAWSWGASNGGPSTSGLTTDNPKVGANCLKLGGGNALGHQEVLTLDSYLDPSATLSLTAWLRTGAGYAGTAGNQAYWALSLEGATGGLGEKVLLAVAASTDWTQQTISIDLPAILAGLGISAPVTRAKLMLINATQGTNGAPGAETFVDDISITWPGAAPWLQGYDADGNTTTLPQDALTLAYDPFLSQPLTADRAGPSPLSIAWLNDGSGLTRSETRTQGSVTDVTRSFFDASGNLIARRTGPVDAPVTTYFVNGPGGVVAVDVDDKLVFTLPDQNGSVRTLVDGTTSQALASYDFDPFGRVMRASGQNDLMRPRFAGLDQDPSLGLYPASGQLYDPSLGRYLMSTASNASLVPYDATPGMGFSYLGMAGLAALGLGLGGGMYLGYLSLTAASQLALAAIGAYNAYQDPAGSLIDVGLSFAASTLSTYTFGNAFSLVEMWTPFAGPTVQFMLGIGAVATTGAGAGVWRRVFDSVTSQAAWDRGYFQTDDLARDAVFALAGHALTYRGNFATAAAKRANYVGAKTEEIYLKFPRLDWSRITDRTYLKAWVIPYKGKTSGRMSTLYNVAKRHGNHHWNAYGYGFAMPVMTSESPQAIRFAEMAMIRVFGQATHLAGAGAGVTQQLFTPGTLANPAYQRAFAEHLWSRASPHVLNPGKALQDMIKSSPLADVSFSYPVPQVSLDWRETTLGQ